MASDVYLGNPLLKKANTPIEFTKEQIEEYIKCKDDPVYFCTKLRPDCNPGPWSSTIQDL